MSRPIDTIDVADLVGVPYPGTEQAAAQPQRQAMHCWDIARAALARVGVNLPVDPAQALASEGLIGRTLDPAWKRRAGDVVMMRNDQPCMFDLGLHIGVVVDADGSVLHATPHGSRIDKLAMLRKARAVVRVVRLFALENPQ